MSQNSMKASNLTAASQDIRADVAGNLEKWKKQLNACT